MNITTSVPEFTITRTLNASRELVWRAWTEKKELAAWLPSTPLEPISFDVREGGRYRYTTVNKETGQEYHTGGVFHYGDDVALELFQKPSMKDILFRIVFFQHHFDEPIAQFTDQNVFVDSVFRVFEMLGSFAFIHPCFRFLLEYRSHAAQQHRCVKILLNHLGFLPGKILDFKLMLQIVESRFNSPSLEIERLARLVAEFVSTDIGQQDFGLAGGQFRTSRGTHPTPTASIFGPCEG